MRKPSKKIGLAIVGTGRVGLIRGEVAARHPEVEWIGIAEKNPERAKLVAEKIEAEFVTADFRELLRRPEVNAAVISTDEHLHVDPALACVERGIPMLIAIETAKVDAVIGYTQRFRRRWLVAKEKVRSGALGDVTMVTSRAFMNRLVAIDNYTRSDNPAEISPMVISGTHALDIVMWLMEAKTPVEVFARSVDKALGPTWKGIDGTAFLISFSDGALYHGVISWALPEVWPGAVYSLEVGAVGTEGVLTIDDTHRDIVLATNRVQGEGYAPDKRRYVDFLTSYPVGDMALGQLRGPMPEETTAWLTRVSTGVPNQQATAREGHNRLMLTKAIDLSARRKYPVKLPITPEDEKRG
jgi:myo-inositol 2-dehydrogenase / D-chiro-inositol 1-dehydrogenase